MPGPESSLHAEYHAALELKHRFDTAYTEAVVSGDLTDAEQLRDQLTEKMDALKEKMNSFETRLKLREQYESQVSMLARLDMLTSLDAGGLGVKGIDGKEYPLPSYEEVTRRMVEQKEVLATKVEQGFTKLLLVPSGLSLNQLIETYRAALQRHFDNSALFYTKQNPHDPHEDLEPIPKLHADGSLWVWDKYDGADTSGALVYEPQAFFSTHGGKTKMELLADGQHGFIIRLVEDMPNIPRQGQGTTRGRPGQERAQLDTGGTSIRQYMTPGKTIPCPREYLQALQQDSQYQHEHGMTPEEQILYALTHLEETNQVIDDYQGHGSLSYQLGAYFPASENVPDAGWYRDVRQAKLGGSDPDSRDDYCGARSAVRV